MSTFRKPRERKRSSFLAEKTVDPELSEKRRRAGLLGAMAKHANNGKGAEVTITLKTLEEAREVLPEAASNGWQILPRDHGRAARRLEHLNAAKDLAADASPGLVRMLLGIAHDSTAGRRERIQAAALVFRVAGIEDAPDGDPREKDITEMSAAELRLFIAQGRARLAETLEATPPKPPAGRGVEGDS